MATTNNSPVTRVLLGTANANGTFTGVTTGSAVFDPGQSDTVSLAVIGNGTIASGVVTIEEAYQVPGTTYAGTWSALATVTASGITGNAQQIVHVSPTAGFVVRVRISTPIGGGGGVTIVSKEQ